MPAAMVIGTLSRLVVIPLGRGTARFTTADTNSYVEFAQHLPRALWNPSPAVLDASLQRTPVYPIFLAIVTGGSAHPSLTLIAAVQCVLGGAINVWLCAVLARRLFGPLVAGAAAVLLAVDPVSIGHSLLVASDTLFVTVFLLTICSAERAWSSEDHRSRVRWGLATGLLLGLAALTRPVMLYAVPVLAIGAAGFSILRRRVPTLSVLVVAAAALMIGSWFVRNEAVTGTWMFSTAQGQNLFDYGAAATAVEEGRLDFRTPTYIGRDGRTGGERTAHDLVAAGERLAARHRGEIDTSDVVARDRDWARIGSQAILEHPRGYAIVAVRGLALALAGPGQTLLIAQTGTDPNGLVATLALVAAVVVLGFQYALGAVGLRELIRGRRRAVALLLILPVVYYLIVSAGPQMYARFRLPVVPLMCILAGVGLEHLRRRRAPVG